MKNSKAMALGLCVVLLVAMTGGIAIAAGEDKVFTGFEDAVDVPGTTYNIDIPPDWKTDTVSVLTDDYFGSVTGTGDWDLYVVTVGPGCIGVGFSMMDCCLPGDTVAFGTGKHYVRAMSPKPACAGVKLTQGTYNIYAAYIQPNSGVFPAEYSMKIVGYWPGGADGEKGGSNVE